MGCVTLRNTNWALGLCHTKVDDEFAGGLA